MRVFVAGTKAEIQPVVQNKLIGSTASDFVATPFTVHSVASARGSADAIQFLAMLSFVSNLVHLSIWARAGTTPSTDWQLIESSDDIWKVAHSFYQTVYTQIPFL